MIQTCITNSQFFFKFLYPFEDKISIHSSANYIHCSTKLSFFISQFTIIYNSHPKLDFLCLWGSLFEYNLTGLFLLWLLHPMPFWVGEQPQLWSTDSPNSCTHSTADFTLTPLCPSSVARLAVCWAFSSFVAALAPTDGPLFMSVTAQANCPWLDSILLDSLIWLVLLLCDFWWWSRWQSSGDDGNLGGFVLGQHHLGWWAQHDQHIASIPGVDTGGVVNLNLLWRV